MQRANMLIGQSGGPTTVINASLAAVVEHARRSELVDRVYGMRFGIEGLLSGHLIDLTGLSTERLTRLARTPSSALGSSRHKLSDDELPQLLEQLRSFNVRYLLMIGGNDTMETIQRVEQYCAEEHYPIHGVGIPKTVDNDLFGTDHTPGFPSAARYLALSALQGGCLARDMRRVDQYLILQTVGRDAGWLPAATAAARQREGDAPHLIYVPEVPMNRDAFLRDATDCIDRHGWVSIVCGEGVAWDDGTPVSASATLDRFSNIEYGAMGGTGAALHLHRILAEHTGLRGEFQIPESLPMCAADRTSEIDRKEAAACGREAARLALSGASGIMVGMKRRSGSYAVDYITVPLQEVARRTKPMPPEYLAGDKRDVSPEFLAYLRPLIGPLPEHESLDDLERSWAEAARKTDR